MGLRNLVELFLFVSSLLAVAVFVFRRVWPRKSAFRSTLINLSLLGFTVLYSGLILEFVFYKFFIQSDGFAFTLASARWFQEYWHPINSYGYRDIEHQDTLGKKNLFVVGDSFVAGHGIKDHQDRFSNVLADKLGDNWEVHSIARGNWNTQDEYRALTNYPTEPDVVIFSYYINDIEGAAREVGNDRPALIDPPGKLIAPVVNRSYFLNCVYWRLCRVRFASDMGGAYLQYLENAFLDPETWRVHRGDLSRLIEYAESNRADAVFLLFPNLADVGGSSKFTAQVGEFLIGQGAQVIDLGEELKGTDPKELMVSPLDGHPSVQLNRRIAELLHDKCQGILK